MANPSRRSTSSLLVPSSPPPSSMSAWAPPHRSTIPTISPTTREDYYDKGKAKDTDKGKGKEEVVAMLQPHTPEEFLRDLRTWEGDHFQQAHTRGSPPSSTFFSPSSSSPSSSLSSWDPAAQLHRPNTGPRTWSPLVGELAAIPESRFESDAAGQNECHTHHHHRPHYPHCHSPAEASITAELRKARFPVPNRSRSPQASFTQLSDPPTPTRDAATTTTKGKGKEKQAAPYPQTWPSLLEEATSLDLSPETAGRESHDNLHRLIPTPRETRWGSFPSACKPPSSAQRSSHTTGTTDAAVIEPGLWRETGDRRMGLGEAKMIILPPPTKEEMEQVWMMQEALRRKMQEKRARKREELRRMEEQH